VPEHGINLEIALVLGTIAYVPILSLWLPHFVYGG
jgi:hypothetical protein